ncbi:hypothetical protein SARC_18272 [Sphaeroforma arctica JP610]|uniref:Uncharacterized protein n=1 Tax=Sphaeroforma arctica JP610 TaxID=667725 RepID=A0A0L0EMX7_9EUKA|nr:hypothetical protein SARC_18272 [Sphaeroforma arctica JP610]KNC65258.1 hypothetical protein SARC_18272 [Sphaeroforma arctica JP610]|eukprot:XP_014143123.1 hypothetical protein SARC_18272 [Sphaeroforma arctica JP610]
MAVSVSDSERDDWGAEDYKAAANVEYKKQSYLKAIDMYSTAIGMDSSNVAYFTNRAAAYMMVKQFENALSDCEVAMRLDPSSVKAYQRAGKAALSLGKVNLAHDNFSKALKLDAKNQNISKDVCLFYCDISCYV